MSMICQHQNKTFTLNTNDRYFNEENTSRVPTIVELTDHKKSLSSMCDLCKLKVVDDWIKKQNGNDWKTFMATTIDNMVLYSIYDIDIDNEYDIICRYDELKNFINRYNDPHKFKTLLKIAVSSTENLLQK